MQRAVSCLGVFVKAGALLGCAMGVFGVPWTCCALLPRESPCGLLAAGLPLALAVTPGCARARVCGGPTGLPALPPPQDGGSRGQPVPRAAHAAQPPRGWCPCCQVLCDTREGNESKISLGTNVKLNKMCVCISQPKPDCAI